MQTYQELLSELETLLGQATGLVSRLGVPKIGSMASEHAVPSGVLEEALRAARIRATQAEAQLVKLQRGIETKERDSQAGARELNRLAFQDALTGLANANLLAEHLEKSLKTLNDSQRILVVVVDLDHFSVINQMLGHDHGDELLVRISERLFELMSELDGVVGRLSEDEFALTLRVKAEAAEKRASELALRVRSILSAPFVLQGQKIPLSASQGGALSSGSQDSGREILQRAQTALAHAKRSGRDQFHLYDPHFERHLRREATLEFQLGFAVEGEELYLEYLPIIWQDELPGGVVHGRLIGVEALLRWNHRVEGVLPAAQFIEAAERSGRVVSIGRKMFEIACRDFVKWRDAGADFYLNFNLSGRELLEPSLAEALVEIADRAGAPRERLTLEFSERCATLDEGVIEGSLTALRTAGFSLALDHFGTGVSSLRRLSSVQFLKLSPTLLSGDGALVDKALSLARGLGLVTVGVGVETAESARLLLQKGCPSVQGFYFSSPLDAAGVLTLYRSHPSWKI